MRMLLVTILLAAAGCTSVYDLGGGRYMVPRHVEVRSPFGTNAGFVKLETCDGVPNVEEGLQPFKPSIRYVNCQGVTDWVPISSQGQGGQMVEGALVGLGFGLGSAFSATSTITNSAASSITTAAPKAHGK